MLQKILRQIENIDEAIRWIKANEPGQYEQRFIQLVTERSRLRRMAAAKDENPAIAAYGESQKGKSYVMSNLLQRDRKPFFVTAGEKKYNFIEEINPPTNDTEATGVVTRFSSFIGHESNYCAAHPVMIRLFSVTEMVAILCDGYFNDLYDPQTMSEDELKQLSQQLAEKYSGETEAQNVVIEDDIIELEEYIAKYIPGKTKPYVHTGYLKQAAQIIRRVPVEEWVDIFAPLWNKNEVLTRLFLRLLAALQQLQFKNRCYLDIDAVLNNNNTIMSVDCLKKIVENTSDTARNFTNVYYMSETGIMQTVAHFEKSFLSAITKEVVFRIDEFYLNATASYDTTDIAPEVAAMLSATTVEKTLLKNNDLLDFPGARARESLLSEKISEALAFLLLRGKVAFLFNSYSEAMSINILLFCHDQQNANVTSMYITLNDWIKKYVGETPEKRAARIREMGVAPFFYIATKFNKDLVRDSKEANNRTEMLRSRWEDRLVKLIYNECFKAESVDWFNNWEAPHSTFKNSYLLRDFKYSGVTGGNASNIYSGYSENGGKEEKCLIRNVMVDGREVDLYAHLRESFVSNEHVRKFFANPAKSWDVAATMNNDGALYIIEKLSIVAANMGKARDSIFADNLTAAKRRLRGILAEYYHDDDADKLFDENLRKGYRVSREMDFTYNRDNYFFGHLIQALQVTEKEMYQALHEFIGSGKLTTTILESHEYEIIRCTCGNFEGCASLEEKWARLESFYGFFDRQEAEEYLTKHGVDPEQLFLTTDRRRLNSAFIASTLFETWKKHLLSLELMDELAGDGGFDNAVMSILLKNIIATAEDLKVEEHVEQIITPYVNVTNIQTVNVNFIADLIATTFNNYIANVGFDYRTEEETTRFRRIAEERHLPLFRYIGAPRKADFNEAELTQLFKSINENPKAIPPAVEQNYYCWKEYMIISFIARVEPGDYDRNANEEMKHILEKLS